MLGWTADGGSVEEDKCIILGVPHTSAWDFVISYLFYRSCGEKAKCMVKKEFFFPPVGWLLRAMGGIPVDRSSPTNMLRSVIEEMGRPGRFHLAIAPEGTRKPVKNWKTGFHLIARSAGIPVYLGYFDWGRKRVGRGQRVELTDDPRADMKRIQELYEQMHLTGKHPEKYITH
ncbi:MAG: 1-acyl-sn-glycerol-3-phosphate acyltransferase [Bacteroidales bacterium]|nr:1-acyl-sn-glycerol-3-phosphate acyltransferase [Bacteroidales bacterium]MBR0084585.1 1-acyl-sn-glycerol-3-phosphate acyltransferase [Bacteroidales bacterium]